ncbi:MAG: AAA family ATPase [Chthonomonadales bacterium]|nr:AAA family ATPase [Chthonomonadales bacterium]
MRFTEVRLENWRNFQRVEVDLAERAFLVGPNAAGKSNLLDAFRFLRDIVAVGGGLQAAASRRGGVSRIRCLAARRYPQVAIAVSLGDGANRRRWQYEVAFTQDNRQRPMLARERVVRDGEELLMRPDADDGKDAARLSQTSLEQINANLPFRDVADLLASVRYLHVVPHLVREPERSAGRAEDPFGGDLLERIARTNEKTRASRLKRILSALKVAVPQLVALELERDDRGAPHIRGRYEHWRPRAGWQGEDQFSDGTLRLLGLLWALLDGTGPLLLEEPELSLHPAVVRHVPQVFARVQRGTGRQVLVSTHSAELLNDSGIGLNEVLLVEPGPQGSTVGPAASRADIARLLRGGMPLGEAVLPEVAPRDAAQLALFEPPR